MWVIQINAVPDELQDTVQGLKISFMSGGIGASEIVNQNL